MKFQTKNLIKNTPHPLPDGTLLRKAQEFMYNHFKWSYPVETLTDEQGRYAYRYKNGVLVARRKPMYDIISVHRKVVGSAYTHNLNVFMYMGHKIYKIDPLVILKNHIKSNQKGDATMINFNVKLLKRVEI